MQSLEYPKRQRHVNIDRVCLFPLSQSSYVLKFFKRLSVMTTGPTRSGRREKQKRPHCQNAYSDEKQKRKREKRRTNLVSSIFNFLRIHFYPSAIATVAAECGECDERGAECYPRYGNVRALLSLVDVTSACLLSVPRVMAFVSAAVTFMNRDPPL